MSEDDAASTSDSREASGEAAKGPDKERAKRVELVDAGDPGASGLPGYIGIGLIGGLIVGWGPLQDAVQGNGAFEDAMVRFVACVLVCVVAASVIGRLFDSAPPEDETASAGQAEASGGDVGQNDAADTAEQPVPRHPTS